MSQKQLNRFAVITKLIDGHITVKEAALCLELSERQIIRLKKGVLNEGPAFLIHKNKGRKPAHAISQDLVQKIVSLKKSNIYQRANFLHFQEILKEYEAISISYSALYNLLKSNGIESSKKRRRFKEHRRRKRKPQEGLLIQMDASPFDWLNLGENLTLHGCIDDATGKITALYLTKNECLQGYFESLRLTIELFGIPVSIYTDRHSIFISPKKNKLSIEEELAGKLVNDTQFGRALKELGITLITARSPQAKGRIERLWETLQSRLPVEFLCRNITTIDQANEFLASFIHKFNEKFAVEPESKESAFRKLPLSVNLDYVLCIVDKRTFDNGGVFSFGNKQFQIIQDNENPSLPPKAKVEVLISPKFGVKARFNGAVYDTIRFINQKSSKGSQKPSETKKNKPWIPPDSHYYKYGHKLIKKVTFEDSDRDILKMLEDIFLSKYA